MKECLVWLVLILAAVFEVGGDALIRRGLRLNGWPQIVAGCAILASYGVIVNLVKWDFSKLLGVYVAFFAITGVLWGLLGFHEHVPASTWLGLAIIAVGGLVIQFGPSFAR